MSIVGIIAEFNPFHNGHKYIIEEAKAKTGCDQVIVIMSGNYVQRGTPAICDKQLRTEMAIKNGCDMVIELPVIYSCASAKYFAEGAVNLLNSLGCVDYLAFGAEYSDADFLDKIATLLSNEPAYYRERLNHYVKNGYSFPSARENALCDYMMTNTPDFDENLYREIMSSPNCILAIEYMCALMKFKSKIKPFPITRIAATYHQLSINEDICSATALRNIMDDFDNIKEARTTIPDSVYYIMKEQFDKTFPIHENDFSYILGSALINCKDSYQDYFDFSLNFSNRVRNLSENYHSFSSFAQELATKNNTLSYARRCLTHLMLGIDDAAVCQAINHGYNYYIRVLGFSKNGKEIFANMKTSATLPLVTKIVDSYDSIPKHGKMVLDINIKADEIYRYVQNIKYNAKLPVEHRRSLVITK